MTSSQPTALAHWLHRHFAKFFLVLVAVATLVGGAYMVNRKTPQDHLYTAKSLQKSGDLNGAIIEFKSALQSMPQNPEVRFLLAKSQFDSNDFSGAEQNLLKAHELGMGGDDLTLLLARTWVALNKPDRVVADIQTRDGAPSDVNAALMAMRAKAQIMSNESATALGTLNEADKLAPDSPYTLLVRAQIAQSQGSTAEALELVEKGLAKNASMADLWELKGELLYRLKQPAPALSAYAKALSLAPENLPARLATIQVHIDTNALAQADAELKILRKYSPANLHGMYLSAQLELARKHYAQALEQSQNVIRAARDFLPAHLLAGEACLALGKLQEAQTHLQRVLDVQPDQPHARRLMAVTLLELGQIAPAKELVTALRKEHDDAFLTTLRGQIALQQEDFSEARKLLQKAADSTPGSTLLYMRLAASQEATGDTQAAIQSLTKAASLDPASHEAESQLAILLVNHRRFDEAIQAVDRMASKHPKPAVLENMRGVIYVAKQDYARARASFEQAMKADPTFMPAISNLANLDVAEQDYKAAKERYEEVLKHAPNDSQVWLALANLADRQKDIEGYRSYLEKAKRANDKNVEVRQRLARYWLDRNNSGLALAEAREGLAATGNKSFYEYIGMALAIQGDTQGALDTFERWSQDSPDSDVAWVRLAQAQAGAGKRRDALASVDRALAIAPNAIEPMNLKMLLLAQQGNRDEALRLARLLQSRQPKSPVGFLGEAEVLSATKKYLEAAKLYEKVAQMTGQSQYTARAYQSYAAAGQASAGVLLLEQSLRAKPDDFKLRHQLAQALINANRQKEAAEQYRLLLRLNPEDVIASNNLAMLLSDLKDPGAVAAAEQAHKLRPENVVIQDSLGWVLVNNGQGARGIKMIKQAYDAKPDSPDFQWHYAKALALTGEPVLARHELESLLARYKNLPQADEARQLLASLKH